ncbi:Cob(I)alamin adenosyltransferase [Tepidanaerobacter acetatoxydans Re1]|uniref:Cob(I)alamin adenosyltransferase n=1 Tax=Tepidanaerobacter acetatoxydans (strain DSM 21804 / JCM 16047 / Re1) TaxID=1209989 RepID=F4LTM4_TEPAE|nr:cob(I)yrinic acid a,c-diamide adenosyltransferase [Tepidanaerobacter acetatoxydans]AEE91354.1 cob(I)alamin adenosyltransferase [Tepidanaerobacter acetatoxydans Re1]CCP26047.1 Cob(I)alamin adenosyltransferase [Tepidanaerobacter acetatoxydans Re1]
MQSKKGLVLVYTGDGKGKTTAALGLALRAAGHGEKVYIIQFMKGDEKYGEVKAIKRYLPNIELVQKGLDSFVIKGNPSLEDLSLAKEGLNLAKNIISSGKYDLVILDEINVAVDYGLLSEQEVLNLIEMKPEHTTIVLTGRYASDKILEKADMVSEVREIKHHYKQGIAAQPGIEY